MNKMKRFIQISVLMLGAAVLGRPAFAAVSSQPDPNRNCSLSINLQPENLDAPPAAGTRTALYYVADADFSGNDVQFTFCDDFADCGLVLDDITDTALAEQLSVYAGNAAVQCDVKTADDRGSLSYTDLQQGLYLLAALEVPEGYMAFEPFLVCLPQTAEDHWAYDVTAVPKLLFVSSEDTRLRVQKVWENDEGEDRPQEVTVRLMNADGVYDTVTLNADINWQYTWDALPDRADWYVQEINVPAHYTVSYTHDGLIFTVKNTRNPDPPPAETTVTSATQTTGQTTATQSGQTTPAPTTPANNGSGEKLVQTGQLKWPVPMLAAGGLLMIACGAAVRSRGRKQNDEEKC